MMMADIGQAAPGGLVTERGLLIDDEGDEDEADDEMVEEVDDK